jgi:hypothetical protein
MPGPSPALLNADSAIDLYLDYDKGHSSLRDPGYASGHGPPIALDHYPLR